MLPTLKGLCPEPSRTCAQSAALPSMGLYYSSATQRPESPQLQRFWPQQPPRTPATQVCTAMTRKQRSQRLTAEPAAGSGCSHRTVWRSPLGQAVPVVPVLQCRRENHRPSVGDNGAARVARRCAANPLPELGKAAGDARSRSRRCRCGDSRALATELLGELLGERRREHAPGPRREHAAGTARRPPWHGL
jgi:hypothetical protein